MTEHTIASLCQRSHQISQDKGWLENPRPFCAISSLIHSEISEALEDYRNNKSLTEIYYEVTLEIASKEGNPATTEKQIWSDTKWAAYQLGELQFKACDGVVIKEAKPCGIGVELADVVIRIAQWCGTHGHASDLHGRVANCEAEHKWFLRYVSDFEHFSALAHQLTSKAYAAWDTGESPDEASRYAKPSEMLGYLADLLHLCFSFCDYHNIDLWAAIDEKEAFNKTREVRHGGKKI